MAIKTAPFGAELSTTERTRSQSQLSIDFIERPSCRAVVLHTVKGKRIILKHLRNRSEDVHELFLMMADMAIQYVRVLGYTDRLPSFTIELFMRHGRGTPKTGVLSVLQFSAARL
jgi:hypothetical protein